MKLFMGIDQSFTSTGTCVVNEAGDVVYFDTVSSDKTVDFFERAWIITQCISGIINTQQPTRIGLEGLAFGGMGDATRQLAGLQYMIVNNIRKTHNQEACIVSPNALKKFATTKGGASKQDMVAALPKDVLELIEEKKYKKSSGLYDVTDAYFIAMYTLEEYKKSSTEPQ